MCREKSIHFTKQNLSKWAYFVQVYRVLIIAVHDIIIIVSDIIIFILLVVQRTSSGGRAATAFALRNNHVTRQKLTSSLNHEVM